MARRWWRKKQLRERYNTTDRSIDRKVKAGILPRPQFPLGGRTPHWDADEVEAAERTAIASAKAGITAQP
jgi:hypothetical protein